MSNTLSKVQISRLSGVLQAGLEQSAATLRMMLGGSLVIRPLVPSLRESGVRIRLGLRGALEGGMHIDLPEQMAEEMVKRLTAGAPLSLLDETARSALMELGNIMASVFVAYFDQQRGLRTLPTPPELSFVAQDIPEYPLCFSAELCWSRCAERGEVLIGLRQQAIDMLLC